MHLQEKETTAALRSIGLYTTAKAYSQYVRTGRWPNFRSLDEAKKYAEG